MGVLGMKQIKQITQRLVFTFCILCLIGSALQAETVTYYITDLTGSPIAAMDEAGGLKWRESYNPYGETRLNPAANKDDVGFTGHQQDDVTGLTYMQARYYDPVIGRFYGFDPVGYTAKNPVMSFNRYLYVNNNPYKYTDPNGEFIFTAIAIVSAAVTAYDTYQTYQNEGLAAAAQNLAVEGALNLVGGGTIKLAGKAFKTAKAILKAGCSFSPETNILTKDGYKTIVEVKVGDLVLSKSDRTNELSWRKVTETFKDWHSETITLTVVDENGIEESVTTTAEHPFYIDEQGWLPAVNITEGAVISGPKSENDISIVKVQVNKFPQYAYNFTVDTDHTYFVGKTNMWVHNACGFGNFRVLETTKINHRKTSIDVERGGSGKINVHAKVGGVKYFRNADGTFTSSKGALLSKKITSNRIFKKAINKADNLIEKGLLE